MGRAARTLRLSALQMSSGRDGLTTLAVPLLLRQFVLLESSQVLVRIVEVVRVLALIVLPVRIVVHVVLGASEHVLDLHKVLLSLLREHVPNLLLVRGCMSVHASLG